MAAFAPFYSGTNFRIAQTHSIALGTAQNSAQSEDKFPPPKTDKPRPHLCTTCQRSFARLEHLKRHERSHTKEKPFECPECARCFARRDLLLRHQQKLHQTALPTSRQRGARRESTSSMTASGTVRVRKSSAANTATGGTGGSGPGSMRPRANTISHVDNATLGMFAATNAPTRHHEATRLALDGLSGLDKYNLKGMSTALGHHGNHHALPKLETHGLKFDSSSNLRTAPPNAGPGGGEVDVQSLWQTSTVNPAELAWSNSPTSMTYDTPSPSYQTSVPSITPAEVGLDDNGNFGWLNGFDSSLAFSNGNEQPIDGSSPSIISTGSHSCLSEVMLDGGSNSIHSSSMWPNSVMSPAPASDYSMDWASSGIPFYHTGQVSPKCLHLNGQDRYFSTPPMDFHASMSTYGLNYPCVHPPMVIQETPSNSADSISSSSNRQSSISSIPSHSVTDLHRQAILSSLTRTNYFPQTQNELLQAQNIPCLSTEIPNLNLLIPSTYDLQRYINAYIQHFHPHLPFLHIPTLSFDSSAYTDELRAPDDSISSVRSGGGGALILAIAAIGAVYEYELSVSKDLYDMAGRMIELFLEVDQNVNTSVNASQNPPSSPSTPLWLVQAMLLNVIYGHNCGDKACTANGGGHCAALVSLTRAADLLSDCSYKTDQLNSKASEFYSHGGEDIQMHIKDTHLSCWNLNGRHVIEGQDDWYRWKLDEERKRTLYAVFILSSLLVSAHNHPPALSNKEIRLDLPCDEGIWAADSHDGWKFMGGETQRQIPFTSALSFLLTADLREHGVSPQFDPPSLSQLCSGDSPEGNLDLKTSTFGCLVLINALHNYVWETRQRHSNRPWTSDETEAMRAHVEPALRAWQDLWRANPHHNLRRPNPDGRGPLSADCIPLLDLAYVRLCINLGRPKEALWQRDELEDDVKPVRHADHSSVCCSTAIDSRASPSTDMSPPHMNGIYMEAGPNDINGVYVKAEPGSTFLPSYDHSSVPSEFFKPYSDRERLLRKAAFYAADSFLLSDELCTTLADFDSQDLPVQSSMCAYECAQVLAEWISLLQQRVGGLLGIGRGNIDHNQLRQLPLLDDEDLKLLHKIREFLDRSMVKLTKNGDNNIQLEHYGYGGKILLVVAQMFRRALVWPGKCFSLSTDNL